MRAEIRPRSTATERYTPEKCHISELWNCSGDPDVSIAEARVEPGVSTSWHRLRDTAERYVILRGTGSVEVGDLEPRPVSAGDIIFIPPLCRQRIINTGSDDLVFLAICTPRFRPDAYEDLEPEPEAPLGQ